MSQNTSGLRRADCILSYFAQEKKPLLIVTVTGILYNVGLAAGPLLEGQLVQCLLEILQGLAQWPSMLAAAALYVAVTLFVQGMRYLKRFYVRRFANDVNRRMKRVLYNSLVHTPKPELERESVGGMMTRAIADVDACAEGMRKFTTEVFDTGVAMAAYLALLLFYDWRLALLVSLFPPAALFLAEHMKKPVARCAAAYKESAGKLSGATLDRVSGAMTYRVFGLEETRNADYEVRLADYEKQAVAANLWENTMPPLYRILSMLGTVPILWLGARNVQGAGWMSWDIAAFTAFLTCYAKLAVKTSKAAKLFNSVQKAQVSWKRVKPLLQPLQAVSALPPAPSAELAVSGLSFSYPGGRRVFSGVSFSARPGQIIGVTGPVACGKSTLGKVFLCETPYGGSIRFGGRELSALSPAEHSAVVGYLGHQPELLRASIAENILLGADGDAAPWLEAVCLDHEVSAMPAGAQTLVGDGGAGLSGGQQSRLALARTLCHRRPLLILDDPFSAVDQGTEQEILTHLRQLAGESVVLLISHRLTRFPTFDQVLWMEHGQVKSGTHAALMASCPEYARLYQAQAEGGARHDA